MESANIDNQWFGILQKCKQKDSKSKLSRESSVGKEPAF